MQATPRRSHRISLVDRLRNKDRKGSILVLSAILMIVMMAMLAFAVDVGYLYTVQTEIQRSVDSAALAGAGVLVEGQSAAEARAIEYLVRNPAGDRSQVGENELAAKIAAFMEENDGDYEIELGHWNPDAIDPETGQLGTMESTAEIPSTIRVAHTLTNHPFFFAPVLGRDTFTVHAESIAMYQPRDIMLVLDLLGSMNDDSEFKSIGNGTFTQSDIENGLEQCWIDMGSPTYGNQLAFQPDWITLVQGNSPTERVQYRWDGVRVNSDEQFSTVWFRYSNGSTQSFNVSPTQQGDGTWQKVVNGGGKRIDDVYIKTNGSWGPKFDFDTDVINNKIRDALNLDGVASPHDNGWNDYFSYCRSSSNNNGDAGYFYKFGYMNLMNYWLEKENAKSDDVPNLHLASAQPITAVKNSVDVFMDYIGAVDAEDRVGLAVYNAPDGNGKLELALTFDYDNLPTIADLTQAGNYHDYTNIAGGMKSGREELVANAREGAFKYMVVMTDGKANWTNGGYSESGAVQAVLNEANAAKAAKIKIVTVSLGAGADTALMQQVADITKGIHFNILGGQSVAEYQQDLYDTFKDIADDRPLRIVR